MSAASDEWDQRSVCSAEVLSDFRPRTMHGCEYRRTCRNSDQTPLGSDIVGGGSKVSGRWSGQGMGYPLTFVYLLAFVAMIVLATALALATPPQRIGRLRVSLVALIATWTLADFLSNLAQTAEQVEQLAYLFAPAWALVPFTLLLTMLVYTEWPTWTRPLEVRVALALPTVGCVFLVHAGLLYRGFLPASVNGHYFQSLPTSWQAVVTSYNILYAALSVAVLLGAARAQGEEKFRTTGAMLLRTLLPVAIAATAINGGLAPLGINPPYLGSVLCSILAAGLGVGVIRREYFAPVARVRRELDAARHDLSRRDEILSALPIGVAILDPETQQMLYANELFRSLSSMGGEGLSSTLRSVVRAPSKKEAGVCCELSASCDGVARSVLVTVHAVHYSGRAVDLVTARDITDTRKLEREIAQQRERITEVQKMEAVGRLSAGIAHDFNNQLSVIVTNASVMLESLGKDPRHRMDLDEIFSAVERGRQLTSQLLAFGRKQAPAPEVLDVNTVLLGLERVLQRLLGSGILLLMRTTPTPALVRVNRSQFEQVVLALATNAADAMPDGGTLTFEVACEPKPGTRGDDRQVVLRVHDTGCGIPADVIDRVFEPFFSTKGTHGTGLGLATAYGYVRSAGGSLTVTSEADQGAEFTLCFEAVVVDHVEEPRIVDTSSSSKKLNPLTILLVDDEDAVRRSLSRVLRQRGHRVVEASGAAEAVKVFGREKVNVLVTDIAMPDTDGRTLAESLQKEWPDLPVLFMSGHLHEQERLSNRSVAFLAKPFAPEVLIDKLEDLVPSQPVTMASPR